MENDVERVLDWVGLPVIAIVTWLLCSELTCACYALMKPALTAKTERSAGLERTVLRTEHPRA